MHEVLVNRLEGLGLPRKSVVRLTDRPDMTLDVYLGRKTTTQQHTREISSNRIPPVIVTGRPKAVLSLRFHFFYVCVYVCLCFNFYNVLILTLLCVRFVWFSKEG